MAPLLAKRLGFDAIDLDSLAEKETGITVSAWIESKGEPSFRDLETRTLRTALDTEAARGLVLACGGGVLGREENRALLRDRAFVVWLLVTPEMAARRLGDAGAAERPLLKNAPLHASLRELWEARRALYEESADAAFETGGQSPEKVAEGIEALWGFRAGRRAWGSSES